MPRQQFTIRNLFVGTLVIGVLLGFLGQEPIGVGLAAIFCVFSWIGILVLSFFTFRNLVKLIGVSIRTKQIRGLTARYRWAYMDASIVFWVIFTVVISNFVVANSVANARYLIWTGWTIVILTFLGMIVRIVMGLDADLPESEQELQNQGPSK